MPKPHDKGLANTIIYRVLILETYELIVECEEAPNQPEGRR